MSTETSVVQYLSLESIFDGKRRFLIPILPKGLFLDKKKLERFVG